MKILVTGAAGFIGYHVAQRLLDRGDVVVGVDNMDPYYDPSLKQARLDRLAPDERFTFVHLNIADRQEMETLFAREKFDRVVHLAAQAGVRHSITHPHDYIDSNVTGTLNVLEGCRYNAVEHLVYASTSSAYGLSTDMPFSPQGDADHPAAIYAASKRATELMAHSYSHLYGLPTTGLRFFTVYGPWGRPDMALFLFTQKMLAGESIPVFNHGKHRRDFTYVDDIAEGVVRTVDVVATPDPTWSSDTPTRGTSIAPWRIYNIGNGQPVPLMRYIERLEECLGVQAEKEYLPMQAGDIEATHADVDSLFEAVGYRPEVSVEDGVRNFVDWYRSYYEV
ncbi:NAD dependent epimerase/dehydratase [Salinisphaera orenii MK-B5]|uniref:NAD dependent epimerase/dehydratase n=1 Tax=Salinisphaera orenii MK-B5 TaxID=856730 RepID=A0A423PK49_9GAMM|nr:NAD-dependent epimerase [Salinisphaera orenii]ROO25959.1 NAD dependent epimerase/dehydratase [Salinisphaera orenii MK-B5]